MNNVKKIESNIPQEKQKYKGWFFKYPERVFVRWSDHDSKKGLTNKEVAEFLEDKEYKGFGHKNELWPPATAIRTKMSKGPWHGQGK